MSRPPAHPVHGSAAADSDLPTLRFRKLVWFVFLYALGALCLFFHGIAFHLTPWSQTIVNGIVKYWYPPTRQEDTTVVLFREENLADLHESYPVSYKGHAEVLDALLAYQARAVFVDFAFVDKRSDPDGVEALQDAICHLAQNSIPVYLAVPPPLPKTTTDNKITATLQSGDKIRPELDPNGAILYHFLGDKHRECTALDNEHPLIKAELVSVQMESQYGVSGVLEYRLEGETAHGKKDAPALAMLPPPQKANVKSKSTDEPMEIIWANGVARLNQWMGCEPENRFTQLMRSLRHDPLSEKLNCPYTQTISVRHLLHSSSDPEVTIALENRAVFYGAGFQMAGDVLVSPVYADLPAVYLHAMAYDNLLTFQNNYKRAEHNFYSLLLDYGLLLIIVWILLFPERLARVIRSNSRSRVSKWLRLIAAVFWVAVAALSLKWPDSWPLWNAFLWVTIFDVSLLVGAFAVLHLDISASQYPDGTREFREFRQHLTTLVGFLPVAVVFLVMDVLLGLEAAVLVALGFYFFYKLFVANDQLFVVTALLLVIASLISFWPLNLGPRNIIAYVLFFEVARHLIEHADEVAAKYRSFPPNEWGWWGRGKRFNLLQLFCKLCDKEAKNANREDSSASSGAGRAASRGVKRGVG